MSAAARSVFVWFHVAAADEAAVSTVLRACHASWMRSTPGLTCELLRRADEGGERITLMEVWRGTAAERDCARLEREAAAALAPWKIGARHVETFEPCA